MNIKWTDGFGEQTCYDPDTGRVLARIHDSMARGTWTADVVGRGYIGEFMTKGYAIKAVERELVTLPSRAQQAGGIAP